MLRDEINVNFKPVKGSPPVRWRISSGLSPYDETIKYMEIEANKIANGQADELVWLIEHPSLYTAGTSAKKQDLIRPDQFEVYDTNRGGEYTYHGPGQRVAYVILDLKRRKQDVRAFVSSLENWIIKTLAEMNIKGERRENRVGVWVNRHEKPPSPDGSIREDKIAAIGIRLRKWVSFHGISINIDPDLEHFNGIIPCGVHSDTREYGVTSLMDLGYPLTMPDVDIFLQKTFEEIFGATTLDQ